SENLKKSEGAGNLEKEQSASRLPNLFCALLGPAVVLGLLAMGPVTGVKIDPLLVLPAGGLVCILVTGHWRRLRESLDYGLGKMSGVAVLLVGTGTLAGVLKNSSMRDGFLSLLQNSGLSETVLAPVSGAIMSGATASTTAGAMVAASSFSETILSAGVSAVAGAAMINAGATILDHLPHGSFFHATAGVLQMPFAERLKLIPLESLIGLILAVSSFWVNL
ncbi:MAG: GntP family permease, partial [Planctomycetia bacterium]|nr:GntP family permease [Planctomycetia bacterium]